MPARRTDQGRPAAGVGDEMDYTLMWSEGFYTQVFFVWKRTLHKNFHGNVGRIGKMLIFVVLKQQRQRHHEQIRVQGQHKEGQMQQGCQASVQGHKGGQGLLPHGLWDCRNPDYTS